MVGKSRAKRDKLRPTSKGDPPTINPKMSGSSVRKLKFLGTVDDEIFNRLRKIGRFPAVGGSF